jgi:hypothetical protein
MASFSIFPLISAYIAKYLMQFQLTVANPLHVSLVQPAEIAAQVMSEGVRGYALDSSIAAALYLH